MTNDKLTAETIRTYQIERLEREAMTAQDHMQVGMCRIATSDSFEGGGLSALTLTDWERKVLRETSMDKALERCADAINAARAAASS